MKLSFTDQDRRNALEMGAKSLEKEAMRLGGVETCLEATILRALASLNASFKDTNFVARAAIAALNARRALKADGKTCEHCGEAIVGGDGPATYYHSGGWERCFQGKGEHFASPGPVDEARKVDNTIGELPCGCRSEFFPCDKHR